MILPGKDDKIVIVGAGCFGISTALHLLERGFKNVTILDRSDELPARDAASNDVNRIVRSSYSDLFYAELAQEAINEWKKEAHWGDSYHESGVLLLGCKPTALEPNNDIIPSGSWTGGAHEHRVLEYAEQSYYNDIKLGARLQFVGSFEEIQANAFPPEIPLAAPKRTDLPAVRAAVKSGQEGVEEGRKGDPLISLTSGYLNRDGGWANAGKGLTLLIQRVKTLGATIRHGPDWKVIELLMNSDGIKPTIVGIRCSNQQEIAAQLVIVAAGAWTPSAFPELELQKHCLATGQCITMIQLSPFEAEKYKNCPVVLDFSSGFYIFPPNEENIVKMALHSKGYTHTIKHISTPRTLTSDARDGLRIPKAAVKALRANLREVYPDLATKDFSATRFCWYNDSPDGDWMIGPHPSYHGLVLATAGSGHAFKFLPVIGRLVADAVQGIMEPRIVQKFAVDRVYTHGDLSRIELRVKGSVDNLPQAHDEVDGEEGPKEIVTEELCTTEDLRGEMI